MDNYRHGRRREASGLRSLIGATLAIAVITAPYAHAENYYLARAIGEPAPTWRDPPRPTRPSPARDTPPELPVLGTEPRAAEPAATESGSTWKWVVGIAVTAAVIALAKGGGDKGGGDTASSGGGTSGGGGNSGGGSGGGNRPLPGLPGLPDIDD